MVTLVTGGLGFIGSNLVKKLVAQGEEVVVLDNEFLGTINNLKDIDATLILKAGVEDINHIGYKLPVLKDKKIDKIYHLAAYSSAPMFHKRDNRISEMTDGFIQLLDFAMWNEAKVVYASTSSLYAGCTSIIDAKCNCYKEDMHLKPRTAYELSKFILENIASVYNKEYNLNVVGLRFFSVYGPNETHKGVYANIITQFLWKMLKDEQPVIYGVGKQTRDFIHVDDVVDALIMSMEKSEGCSIYNVGTSQDTSFNTIVHMLNHRLQKNIMPLYNTHTMPNNYVFRTNANIKLIEKEIGWKPKITLYRGIEKLITTYQ